MISVLQTPVLDAHLDGRSLLQAVEKDGRPLSSLRRISQSLRDPSSCRSEASCLERVGLHDRSPGTTGTHSAGRVGIAGEIIRLPGHASRLRRRMLWRDCILLTPASQPPHDLAPDYPRLYAQRSHVIHTAAPGPTADVERQAPRPPPTPPGPPAGPPAPPPRATRSAAPSAPSRAVELPRPPWAPRGRWAPRARPFARCAPLAPAPLYRGSMRGGQGNTETYFQVPIQAGSMLLHAMSVISTDPADLNGFYLVCLPEAFSPFFCVFAV